MDSGNSESSSQSTSSCGDGGGGGGEYDSRAPAETISPSLLLNTLPNHHLITPNQQPPPQHHHHHQQHQHPNLPSSMFDPLTNFNNVNPLVNFDMVWSKSVRSDPNCTDLLGLLQAPPVPSQGQNMSAGYALIHQGSDAHDVTVPPNNSTTTNTAAAATMTTNNNSSSINNNSLLQVRNPKKRSRASRRAPTTVLTTDTTNFRAMVQEFTGIPSPPFTSSTFHRGRLDLFATPNPYPLRRPLAQKIQKNPLSLSGPFVSRIGSDTMIDAFASISPTTPRKHTFSNPASVNTFQLPPSSLVENNSMPNNPVLNLQSLVQAPIKFPLSNSVFIGSKNVGPVDHNVPANVQSHGNMGNNIFEELGLSHGSNNVINTTQQQSNRNDQGLLGLLNGSNYGGDSDHHQAITNGKINCSSSSATEFRGDNNVNARTEGMVESWIRSSD